MTLPTGFCLFGCALGAWLLCAVPVPAQEAEQKAAVPPPAVRLDNSRRLEVEIVEVHNRIAIPNKLQRKAGPFILAVTNRTDDPAAWFVVDAAPPTKIAAEVGTDVTAPSAVPIAHVLTVGPAQYERRHRAGAIFNAKPGTYLLKSGTHETVLCTLVIE